MLAKILVALVVIISIVIAGFVAFIETRPDDFLVERSITIAAPADKVFPHVNDLHQWNDWSPWGKIDPDMKMTYAGEESGVGAIASWAGNDQVGVGSMTITDSRLNTLVRLRLDFLKPTQTTNTAQFSFAHGDKQTTVTWSMFGRNGFIGKAMCVIYGCDKMVGSQFEKGLADLNKVVETQISADKDVVTPTKKDIAIPAKGLVQHGR